MKRKIVTALLCLSIAFSLTITAFSTYKIDVFKPTALYSNTFSDNPSNKWYYQYVKACYEFGIMKGTSGSKFSPKTEITVGEVITVAARIHSIYNNGKNTVDSIAKKSGEKWYTRFVNYAVDNKLIGKNDFSDEDYKRTATRAEIVHIVSNVLPKKEYSVLNDVKEVPDMSKLAKYYSEVLDAYKYGIVNGDENGNFNPDGRVSRSEAATIFSRIVIPTLRTGFNSYKKHTTTVDDCIVTVSVPTKSTVGKEKGMDYISATEENMDLSIDASEFDHSEMSIVELFGDEMVEELYTNDVFKLKEDDGLSFVSLNLTPVKYGDVDAYRMAVVMKTNGKGDYKKVAVGQYVYFYVITFFCGDTWFDYIFASDRDVGTIRYMVNSLKINGSAVNSKL